MKMLSQETRHESLWSERASSQISVLPEGFGTRIRFIDSLQRIRQRAADRTHSSEVGNPQLAQSQSVLASDVFALLVTSDLVPIFACSATVSSPNHGSRVGRVAPSAYSLSLCRGRS